VRGVHFFDSIAGSLEIATVELESLDISGTNLPSRIVQDLIQKSPKLIKFYANNFAITAEIESCLPLTVFFCFFKTSYFFKLTEVHLPRYCERVLELNELRVLKIKMDGAHLVGWPDYPYLQKLYFSGLGTYYSENFLRKRYNH
jgi:hypothetical protein